jgi:hypothetical protein
METQVAKKSAVTIATNAGRTFINSLVMRQSRNKPRLSTEIYGGITMTKLELLEMANRFYPDSYLSEYYDKDGNYKENKDSGDGLAQFIVAELSETFDETASSHMQLEEAKRIMHNGIRDITYVLAGLDDLKALE